MRKIWLWLILGIFCLGLPNTGCRQAPREQTDATARPTVLIDAPCLSQMPTFPTGCEIFATVMALQYLGESVTPMQFWENHIEKNDTFYYKDGQLHGPNPTKTFVGDAHQANGYGCFAPVIQQAVADYFGCTKSVQNTTGNALSSLCENYIDQGIPVIIWASSGMRRIKKGPRWILPNGDPFTWPSEEHCLLLVGYNETHYFFNDSNEGKTVAYPRATVEKRYASLGKQSLVILPT